MAASIRLRSAFWVCGACRRREVLGEALDELPGFHGGHRAVCLGQALALATGQFNALQAIAPAELQSRAAGHRARHAKIVRPFPDSHRGLDGSAVKHGFAVFTYLLRPVLDDLTFLLASRGSMLALGPR